MSHQSSLPTILQTAVRHHQARQFRLAEKCCIQACAISPNQPDALHLLAVIHAQTGRHESANRYFVKAITVNPLRADFLCNYANSLWKQGCIEEAVKICQRSLEIDTNRAETHNILGNIYLSQNRLEKASACFQYALTIQPNFPHALNNLGITLQKMKKADEAWDHFQTTLKLQPGFQKAARNAAEVNPVWLAPLDGKKLHLRRYRAEDATFLHQCYKNMKFMSQYNHYIPRHQHFDDLVTKLRQSHNKHPCLSKSIDWIIINKHTQKPAGVANLVEIQFLHQRAEFLIGLPNPTDHASGIGLEATLLVLDFVFNRAKLNKLTAMVYGDNTSSQKNSLAIGFVQESYQRVQIFDPLSGKFLNLYGNGMTLNDFRTNTRLPKLSQRLLGREITKQSNNI